MNRDPNRITAAMEITEQTTARAFMTPEQRERRNRSRWLQALAIIEAAMVLDK